MVASSLPDHLIEVVYNDNQVEILSDVSKNRATTRLPRELGLGASDSGMWWGCGWGWGWGLEMGMGIGIEDGDGDGDGKHFTMGKHLRGLAAMVWFHHQCQH